MKVLIQSNGDIVSVYNDKLQSDKLGKPCISRASNVEFNNTTQLWEATLPSGETISSGKKREDVIKAEIKHLEQNLATL